MNTKKGFTLFTALVSLILVSISLALVFNMIATEETYIGLIQDQVALSDIITIGDLAKADAFNTFLINLRSAWEESKSTATFKIDRKDLDKNWTQYTEDFVKKDFFEKNFAIYFARALYYQLEYKQNPPGYSIAVKKTGDEQQFGEIISQLFLDGGEQVDVIDCDTESDTCIGSFYLTLDVTKISDENYEKLPIVTVHRYLNNQVIQRPILNKQIYKIYIPWRGFQAFRVVRRIALGDAEKEDYPASSENYNGIFNPEVHNALEQARLGFCDPGTCLPRTSFYQTPNKTGFDEKCKNIGTQLINNPFPEVLGVEIEGSFSYNPLNLNTTKDTFLEIYKGVFQSHFLQNTVHTDTNLILQNIALDLNIESKRTKTIEDKSTKSPKDYDLSTFSNMNDISKNVGGLGLFIENNSTKYIYDKYSDWFFGNNNKTVGDSSDTSEISFECAEIKYTTVVFEFIETDPKYFIKEQYGGEPVKIKIELVDTYTSFYFPPESSWLDLKVNGQYKKYIDGKPKDIEENFQKNWTCYSFVDGDGGRCNIPPDSSE